MGKLERVFGDNIGYHVIARFNNKERYLSHENDCRSLSDILRHYQKKLGFDLHAYVFMQTHVHLMLTTHGDFYLNHIMHRICSTFAHAFNQRHNRSGHVWLSRYRSLVIDNDSYALACLRYMDLNPVRAGLVTISSEWKWSSHRFYAEGNLDKNIRLIPHVSYLTLAHEASTQRKIYRSFFSWDHDEAACESQLFEGRMRPDSRRGKLYLRWFSDQLHCR